MKNDADAEEKEGEAEEIDADKEKEKKTKKVKVRALRCVALLQTLTSCDQDLVLRVVTALLSQSRWSSQSA